MRGGIIIKTRIKWRKTVLYYISVIIIFAMAGALYKFFTFKKVQQVSSYSTNKYEYPGYTISLITSKNQTSNSLELNMTGKKVFDYNIKFVNNSKQKNTFALTTYIDYKQISFGVNDVKDVTSVYKFELNSGDEKIIPIRFGIENLPYGNHILNFVVNDCIQEHSLNIKDTYYDVNNISRYDLVIGNDQQLSNSPHEDGKNIFKSNHDGLYVNEDINKIKNNEKFLPPKLITVKPGEKFKIPIVVGSSMGAKEYMFWITTDWNQTKFDSKASYWNFTLPQGYCKFKEIEINAPEKKGTYEMMGFLSLNPWSKISGTSVDIRTFTSQRFTLVVE